MEYNLVTNELEFSRTGVNYAVYNTHVIDTLRMLVI